VRQGGRGGGPAVHGFIIRSDLDDLKFFIPPWLKQSNACSHNQAKMYQNRQQRLMTANIGADHNLYCTTVTCTRRKSESVLKPISTLHQNENIS